MPFHPTPFTMFNYFRNVADFMLHLLIHIIGKIKWYIDPIIGQLTRSNYPIVYSALWQSFTQVVFIWVIFTLLRLILQYLYIYSSGYLHTYILILISLYIHTYKHSLTKKSVAHIELIPATEPLCWIKPLVMYVNNLLRVLLTGYFTWREHSRTCPDCKVPSQLEMEY